MPTSRGRAGELFKSNTLRLGQARFNKIVVDNRQVKGVMRKKTTVGGLLNRDLQRCRQLCAWAFGFSVAAAFVCLWSLVSFSCALRRASPTPSLLMQERGAIAIEDRWVQAYQLPGLASWDADPPPLHHTPAHLQPCRRRSNGLIGPQVITYLIQRC